MEISKPQKEILYCISQSLTVQEIAKYRNVSRNSVYKVINLLLKKGFIRRISNPKLGDSTLELTDIGKNGLDDSSKLQGNCIKSQDSLLRKRTTKEDSQLFIFNQIKLGKRPSQISEEFKIPLSTIQYPLDFLKKEGFIVKRSNGIWEILKHYEKSSLGTTKPISNLHALQIRFPILSGTIKDSDWQIKEKLNHWLPKYTNLKALGGLVVKNNNNKSITVWAEPRNFKSLEEVTNLAYQIRTYIYQYFKAKHDVELDIFNCETKNLDMATEDKVSEGMLRKGEKFKLKFDKKAKKIFPRDNLDSEAHIDGSPFKFTAETNDLDWKREYLRMPFTIQETSATMQEVREIAGYLMKFYKGHVGIVEKLNKILGKKEAKKHIKKKVSTQASLSDF